MPRVCTVCVSPHRADIDRQLATGEGVKRAIAARYGLTHTSLGRHQARHLDPRMIEAHRATLEAEAVSARDIILEVIQDLREDRKACRGVSREQYESMIDRLIKANDQYARINKEIGSDQVNALFVNLGVRTEDELRSRLALVSGSENLTLEAVVDSACETIETAGRKDPAVYVAAMRRLERASVAVEVNGNGRPSVAEVDG